MTSKSDNIGTVSISRRSVALAPLFLTSTCSMPALSVYFKQLLAADSVLVIVRIRESASKLEANAVVSKPEHANDASDGGVYDRIVRESSISEV